MRLISPAISQRPVPVSPHQLGLTPLGKHSAGARQVMVSGDPAAHIQPLGRPSGRRAVLSVQQHQLLLSPNGAALQHLLQLQDNGQVSGRTSGVSSFSPVVLPCEPTYCVYLFFNAVYYKKIKVQN